MSLDDGYTVALLHMEGADASTTFIDESGKTWTARGNAKIVTAQKVFGDSSAYFDGAGDNIDTPDHADWHMGTGDFAVDFRLRLDGLPASYYQLFEQALDTNNRWRLYYGNAASYAFYFRNTLGGATSIDMIRTITLTTLTWYHVAITRNGNNTRVFVNGTQVGATATDSYDITDLNGPMYLGCGGGGLNYAKVWMDEVRFSKGTARWTADFTPPISKYGSEGYPKIMVY
jgi:hypothetical protein